jgi:hypothetical protein
LKGFGGVNLAKIAAILIAASTVSCPSSALAAAPVRKAATVNSPQKAVDDVRAMADWMAQLLAAQDKAINVLLPIENAWAELDRVSDSKDQTAINAAHDKIDEAIAQAKAMLAESKSEIDALPSLAKNSVMRELPVGHEARLRQFSLDTVKQFSNIVDQGETMSLAIAAGERELAEEFSDLMLDARDEVFHGQRAKIEIMAAAAKRGSVNEAKLMTLGKATEAMHILFKGQINMLRDKPANFDVERLSAIGAEIAAINDKGHTAHKAELAQFARERKFIIPAMIAPNQRVHDLNGEWLNYADGIPLLIAEVVAAIPAAGDDLDMLEKLFNKLVTIEDEYVGHSQKLIASIQGI